MLIKEALSILQGVNTRIQEIGAQIVNPDLVGSPKQSRLQDQLKDIVMRYTMLLQHIILNDDGDQILGTIGENDTDLNAILIDLQTIAQLNRDVAGTPVPRTTYIFDDGEGLPDGALGDILYFDGSSWTAFQKGASGEVLVSTPTTIQWQSVVGNGLPAGGSTNQYLKKNSNTSYDVVWDTLTISDVTDITATAAQINILTGVTVTTAEINYLSGVTSPIQTQLNAKLSTTLAQGRVIIGDGSSVATAVNTNSVGDILADTTNGLTIKSGVIVNADISASAAIARSKLASGTANRIIVNDASGVMMSAAGITAARVLISDANGIPTHSSITSTTLAYLDATSSIQTQLNNRLQFSSAITPVEGDLIYFNGTTWVNLAIGTNGQLLKSNGTTVEWVTDPPTGLPSGGTTAQFLNKVDNTDYNAQWHTLVVSDLTDLSASAAELNILSGVTVTNTEINYLAGVTSLIQTQLNNKLSNSLALNSLFIGNASNQASQLPPGSNGQILTIVGASPQWTTPLAAGDVSGPGVGNSTDNAVVRWNTTSGSSIQNSNVILGDNGVYTFPDDGGLQTGTSNGDVLYVKAYDVDGTAYINFITLTAANTPTMDIHNTTTVGGELIYRSIAGYPIAPPTSGDDTKVITWDNGSQSWIYTTGGGGGVESVTGGGVDNTDPDNPVIETATVTQEGTVELSTEPESRDESNNARAVTPKSLRASGGGLGIPVSRTVTDHDTLEIGDLHRKLVFNISSNKNLTISNSIFGAGDVVYVERTGAGTLSFVAGGGMTLTTSLGSLTDAGANNIVVLLFTSSSACAIYNGTPNTAVPTSRTLAGLDLTTNRTASEINAALASIFSKQLVGSTNDRYHTLDMFGHVTMSTSALATGSLRARPLFSHVDRNIDRLGVEVTTFGTDSKLRIGIYEDNGSNYPGALFFDSGEIDTGSNGVKLVTVNINITGGKLYWAAVLGGTASCTYRSQGFTILSTLVFGITSAFGGTHREGYWQVAQSYGALPGTFPGSGTINSSSNNIPLIGFRLSA